MRRPVPFEPRSITSREEAQIREWFAAWVGGDYSVQDGAPATSVTQQRLANERAARMAEARRAITFPATFPPVRQVVAGHDGSIWLLREMRSDGVDRWDIHDAAGVFRGHVEFGAGRSDRLPFAPRVRVLRATLDDIWVTTRGEFDVPYIHRYRMLRRAEREGDAELRG